MIEIEVKIVIVIVIVEINIDIKTEKELNSEKEELIAPKGLFVGRKPPDESWRHEIPWDCSRKSKSRVMDAPKRRQRADLCLLAVIVNTFLF